MATVRYYVKDKRGQRVGGELSSRLHVFDAAYRAAEDMGESVEVWEHFSLTPEMETDRPLARITPCQDN